MPTSVKELLAAAHAAVPKISHEEAQKLMAAGNVLVVDVRDGSEVEISGKVQSALHVSRGMLEFRADPDSPIHDSHFAKDKTIIVYCGTGGRAALSGKTLKDLGFADVRNLGSFKDWMESGRAIERGLDPST